MIFHLHVLERILIFGVFRIFSWCLQHMVDVRVSAFYF